MFGRLFAKEADFFESFEKHMHLIKQAVKTFSLLISSPPEFQRHCEEIRNLEHQADEITHHCIEKIHKTFITPFDQEDIYRLISRLDDILDFIQGASECIILYKLTEMTPGVHQLSQTLTLIVQELDSVLQAFCRKQKYSALKERFHRIHQLETAGDHVMREALGHLFDDEKNPLLVIKWKEVYEDLENAIDTCEDVANIIEGIMLEMS